MIIDLEAWRNKMALFGIIDAVGWLRFYHWWREFSESPEDTGIIPGRGKKTQHLSGPSRESRSIQCDQWYIPGPQCHIVQFCSDIPVIQRHILVPLWYISVVQRYIPALQWHISVIHWCITVVLFYCDTFQFYMYVEKTQGDNGIRWSIVKERSMLEKRLRSSDILLAPLGQVEHTVHFHFSKTSRITDLHSVVCHFTTFGPCVEKNRNCALLICRGGSRLSKPADQIVWSQYVHFLLWNFCVVISPTELGPW